MDLTLNDAQLRVLRWVAAGADLDTPPNDSFKTNAVALRNRGLVGITRPGGRWTAAITEAGRFYLDHGRHPRDTRTQPTISTPTIPKREQKTSVASPPREPADTTETKQGPPVAKCESIPMPDQVRRPHPAVREIVEHKARLDVPAEQRQRALLVLHALAQEAVRRGWTVTPNPSAFQRDRWNDRRTRVSPGPDLFSIDAGAAPVAIRLRMKQKRVEYAPTEEELARSARYGWRSYRRYNYLATEFMRLEVRASTSSVFTLDDTASKRIEDRLLRAVEAIERRTVEAREAAERHRLREIERAEQQRRAEELRQRVARYSGWVATLDRLQNDLERHRALTDTVAALRAAAAAAGPEQPERLGGYVTWAEEHLAETDPLRHFRIPEGERPDLSYDERSDWQRRHPDPQRRW